MEFLFVESYDSQVSGLSWKRGLLLSRKYKSNFLPKARRGSATLLAFTVLAVLIIVGISFNESAHHSILQTYRFKTREKALALGDGLAAVAKKIVEAAASGDSNGIVGKLEQLEKDGDVTEEIPVFSYEDGEVTSGDIPEEYRAALTQLGQNSDGSKDEFSLEATVRFKRDRNFQDRGHYANEKTEFRGTAFLTVVFNMNINLFTDGGKRKMTVGEQTIETQFEFKRVRVQPPVVRHFTLFAENTKESGDDAGSYRKGQFNNFYVSANGNPMAGSSGCLVLDNGASIGTAKKSGANPFSGSLGYILLGTGGKSDKSYYLNLTAGNGPLSESFQLYRGKKGESDFYQLFTSDYATVLNRMDKLTEIKDRNISTQIKSVNRLLEDQNRVSPQNPGSGLAYYYLARKDYGYADDWKKHPEFGFIPPNEKALEKPMIPSSSLHLFGGNENPSFTLVFGNVYRRCLSLSGYKQVKANVTSKPEERGFEIQAGPIYFYRNFKELHDHKLYLPKSLGAARGEPSFAPIEVWDSRMNWVWPTSGVADKLTGSWTFISGDGLMMRLIPSIAGLFSNSNGENLFNQAVGVEPASLYSKVLEVIEENSSTHLISPFLKAYYEQNNQKWPDLFKDPEGQVFKWSSKAEKLSAYMKELLIQFYFNSYTAYNNLRSDPGSDNISEYGPEVKAAAQKWQKIVDQISNKMDKPDQPYYSFSPISSSWSRNSRVFRQNKWNEAGGEKTPVLYFTLPDPWEIASGNDSSELTQFVRRGNRLSQYLGKQDYNQAIQKFQTSNVSGGETLFNEYFKKIMTDPAWVLPYNYSNRFGLPEFKEMYFTREPKGRQDFMETEAVEEFRDGIGYFESKINPYMEPKSDSEKNKPLGPDFQERIIRAYRDDPKYKDKHKGAYSFVSELGSSANNLEELNLKELYRGRCIYRMDSDEFKDKFFNTDTGQYDIHTVVCIDGDLELNGIYKGVGVLHVAGTVKITGHVNYQTGLPTDGTSLVVSANQFEFGSNTYQVKASLIQRKEGGSTSFSLDKLTGNFVLRDFGGVNVMSGRSATLKYDSSFLKNVEFVVGFQPYIKSWSMPDS
jgi:hypothetical protein